MVDPSLLRKHYRTKEELRQIEFENDKRKSLIRLAVLRVVALSKEAPTKKSRGNTLKVSESEESTLYKKNAEYELTINRLKQDSASKEMIMTSKIEALKSEVQELKKLKQAKFQPKSVFSAPSSSNFQPQISVPAFRAPKALNSTFPRFQSSSRDISSALSPTYSSLSKSTTKDINDDDILTPVKAKRKLVYPIPKKREYMNYNTIKKSLASSGTGITDLQITPKKKRNNKRADQNIEEDEANSSFIASFDRSPNSKSPSPEFSPTKMGRDVAPKDIQNEHASEVGTEDKDSFISANSTFDSGIADNTNKKKRKRRLQLWKAESSQAMSEKRKNSGVFTETDDINSVKYYHDDNFDESESTNGPLKRTFPLKNSSDKRKKV